VEDTVEIHLGCDHRGYHLKQQAIDYLLGLGHHCTDHGTYNEERVDYPNYARLVGESLAAEAGSLGLVFCGSGAGIAIAANKMRGVRCSVAWCEHIAEFARRHNHANCLAFSGDLQTWTVVRRCIDAYLAAEEEGERHAERVEMVRKLESQ
jgi:ribose 5-phosphate isomerase B